VKPARKNGGDCNSRFVRYFAWETPFVKDSNSAHGSTAEQSVRRTVCKTKYALPNLFGRAEVVETAVKEYIPIQSAYVNLRKQTARISDALRSGKKDVLQPLLTGSWATQVNEGPTEYFEVFIKDKEETKHTQKLKRAYLSFMKTSKEGIQAHAEYCLDHPAFLPLQEVLEANFQSAKSALLPHLVAK
jgi:hypothetical protein